MSKKVSAEALFKALDDLEQQISKGGEMPSSTKKANGGLAAQAGGEGPEADVDADGDGEDPTGKSLGDEVDLEKGDDEDADDEQSEEASEEESDDEASKSLREDLEDNEVIAKGMEVSTFLEELVDTSARGVDRLSKSIAKQQEIQLDFNTRIAKALTAIGHAVTSMQAQLSAIGEAPAAPGPRAQLTKSVTAAQVQATGGAVERFAGEDAPEFSKSDALEALITLAQSGKVHPAMVAQYESTGSLPAEVVGLVEQTLKRQA